MMGVATRGVKFKFSIDERVLCYEPDPTKAKVLYESKVLDLVVSRDERGRKVPEYLIHFFGWNSSWDRCVREEFILPYTEENRELQVKLSKDAASFLKGKRKSKLLNIAKETKKQGAADSGNERSENQDPSRASSESDSSEEEYEKEVVLSIPEILRQQLEEDWKFVTKRNKLVRLPCQTNVIAILEAFVKYLAAQLLCASPPKGKELTPEDVHSKLNLYKEAMDGIRVYFDFTLPHLLLYRQEKKQYYTDAAVCSPLGGPPSAERDAGDSSAAKPSCPVVKIECEAMDVAADHAQKEAKESPRVDHAPIVLRQKGRPSLKKAPPALDDDKPKIPPPGPKKAARGRPRNSSTRVLRSSDRQKVGPEETPEVGTPAPPEEMEVASPPASPPPPESRVTRKSAHHSPPPVVEEKPAVPCGSASNGLSPSEPSTTASQQTSERPYQLANNASQLSSWRMVPPSLYSQVPSAPSLVYGPQHLLRLFVKLPDLISKMSISSLKLRSLLSILDSFLMYLAERKEQLFLPSAYVDPGEGLGEVKN